MVELLKNRYKIVRKIGAGGMAQIFLAIDTETDQEVAIKFLSPDQKGNYAPRQRFLSEIKITQKIRSPYVVKILDYVWDDTTQCIVMEYIDGDILKDYINRKTRLTVDEVVEFGKQLAQGFDEIHRMNIIHRDIKSSNIMVGAHGQIKIIDFGIALTEESERLTKTDSVIGSIQYMAPEIIDQIGPSIKTDIYAFGILLFEMLTGSVPFKEKDIYTTAMKHRKSNVPHVNKIFNNIPNSLSNIVAKATQREARYRYDNMHQIYRDLETCLESSKMNQSVYNPLRRSTQTLMDFINSKLFLILLISLIVFIVVTVIVVTLVLLV